MPTSLKKSFLQEVETVFEKELLNNQITEEERLDTIENHISLLFSEISVRRELTSRTMTYYELAYTYRFTYNEDKKIQALFRTGALHGDFVTPQQFIDVYHMVMPDPKFRNALKGIAEGFLILGICDDLCKKILAHIK